MKFLVTYQMPHAGLDEWMQMPEAERKAQEEQMQSQWDQWLSKNNGAVIETAGVGKPKRVTSDGITDARNDIMMYSIVEADSLEGAAALFEGHPHFGIPNGWIEVMAINNTIS